METVFVFGSQIRSTPLITYTTAAAFLVVAFLSPLLSGIADYVGNKKKFMKFFCYLGALSCMGLYFFSFSYHQSAGRKKWQKSLLCVCPFKTMGGRRYRFRKIVILPNVCVCVCMSVV